MLRLEQVTALREDTARALLFTADQRFVVERDSRGRYLIVDFSAPTRVSVLDASGRLIGGFGRQGSGPGEFNSVYWIRVAAGDSLLVYDAELRRLSLFAPDYRFVRAFPAFPGQITDAAVRSADDWTIAMLARTPSLVGKPLHTVRDGTLIRSFGQPLGVVSSRQSAELTRHLASMADGSVVVLHAREYRIDIWDAAGKHRRILTMTPDAIKPTGAFGNLDVAPQPFVAGLYRLDERTVLVAYTVADSRWRSAIERGNDSVHGGWDVKNVHRYRDLILDAIDIQSGAFVGRVRSDSLVHAILKNGQIARIEDRADGSAVLRIFRVLRGG